MLNCGLEFQKLSRNKPLALKSLDIIMKLKVNTDYTLDKALSSWVISENFLYSDVQLLVATSFPSWKFKTWTLQVIQIPYNVWNRSCSKQHLTKKSQFGSQFLRWLQDCFVMFFFHYTLQEATIKGNTRRQPRHAKDFISY